MKATRGLLDWFAGHSVAANMLMWLIVAGGFMTLANMEQEVFPEVDSEVVLVEVEFRGASPSEVEEGICIKVEEAVFGIEGIDKVTSSALPGRGQVVIKAESGYDLRELLDDVQAAVDAIDTFPELAEAPEVRELELARQVLNVAVSGPLSERALRETAEWVRDELLALPDITRVSLGNVRPYELALEVSERDLRRLGLTFDEVVAAVRAGSLDLSAGEVETEGRTIRLRAESRAYRRAAFEQLVLRTRPDGTRLLLGDVATVLDGFEATGQSTRFDGAPGVIVKVWRIGDQRALDMADAVKAWVARSEDDGALPEGVQLTLWQDETRVLNSRLDLLVRNGRAGLVLVFITLALFLRLSLAMWVSLGIPISFLGAIWLLPAFDVSLNMISLFGFLVALGIVVDDAIVVGENVYKQFEDGARGLSAVRKGAGQVAVPVIFAILTTIAAFSPLLGIPGVIGSFMEQLPLVVVPVLVFSMIESLLILPAHLVHVGGAGWRVPGLALWEGLQAKVSWALARFIERVYVPSLDLALRWRGATLAFGVALLLVTGSAVAAGHIRFLFFPPVEADNVLAWVTMPRGTPEHVTDAAVRRMEAELRRVAAELEAEAGESLVKHVLASVGDQPFRVEQSQGFGNVANFNGDNLGEVNVELVPAEERETSSRELLARWREAVGEIAGAVELTFSSDLVSTGRPVDVELTGPSVADLRAAAAAVKQALHAEAAVFDVADSFRSGQDELRLEITPEGEALGFTRAELARQVRQGWEGDEAQRIQRGRDEVRVVVRYPADERVSLVELDDARVTAPGGARVPLSRVARWEPALGDAVIDRSNRQRRINVTADVDLAMDEPNAVLARLAAGVLPELEARHRGLRWSLEGEQKEQGDTIAGLAQGFILALIVIFALLAVPFRSYVQPLIVMSAIPFGIVGAIWGHLALGMDLTVMSMFGVVALTGVLVNDSLVLVDFANRAVREEGLSVDDAIRHAGPARFRPILLTSLTTFMGLLPLLLERSLQAQFLIPMGVSLGFGVLFATFITLILVPTAYRVVEDVRERMGGGVGTRSAELAAAEA